MKVVKIFYVIVVVAVLTLAFLVGYSVASSQKIERYVEIVDKVYSQVDSDNSVTNSTEKFWDGVEDKDDSAIRGQIYEMRAIRARLQNIDSTIEKSIILQGQMVSILAFMLKIQIYLLAVSVSLLVLFAIGSLLLR